MFHMHAAVDPASGALLERAINAVAEELWRAEHPDRATTVAPRETYERRRADALVTIAERILAGDSIKRRGGSGIDVVAIIDFQVLLERLDDHGVATLSDGTPIPAGLARMWACEHGIIPVVLGTNSVPLDWGEKRRLATPAQRQALLLRSSTCEFAGCTVSAYGCRVHHLEGSEDTHSTDYDNLGFACAIHHRLIHLDGWRLIRGPDNTIETYRPDGTRYLPEPRHGPTLFERPPPGDRAGDGADDHAHAA